MIYHFVHSSEEDCDLLVFLLIKEAFHSLHNGYVNDTSTSAMNNTVMTEEKRKKGEELLRLIELGSVGN